MRKVKVGECIVSLFIFGITLFLDQSTKWSIVHALSEYDSIEMIPHFFDITYVKNTGAGFSILEGASVTFFVIFTVVVLIGILYYFIKTDDLRFNIALSLIFSGALGNLIDRIEYGYVRDFFSFRIFGHPFPVFNVADICIVIGFGLILIFTTIDEVKEKKRWKQKLS